ncbi:hypothetical protein AcW1_003518 [Taiwanofungus camphoratus]|nr:hypothetical protein AcV5_002017 [Antrodia cinnamomea]KAI0941702.1 hypothetical protein AcW1_003518 [Antrodia cinnamomea]KAI0943807.1 hypothetical protein AcV7_001795 [Antrodia cinnamomea]
MTGVDIEFLEPKIRKILTAPGTDLSTISAKRVRRQLLEQDASLPPELIKEKKEDIDLLIENVYEQVSAEIGNVGEGDSDEVDTNEVRVKRKRDDDKKVDGNDEEDEGSMAPKVKKARKSDVELTDAELARQLSNEINGRSRSSRTSTTKTTKTTRGKGNGSKRGGKRGAKSAAVVDSDGDGEAEAGQDGEGKKKKRGGGFQKEYILSEPLSTLLSVDKLSRPQVVKQLWDYIKRHELQNPENRKEIVCDDSLKSIFGVDKIDMFKMNKVLGQHLHEP